MLRISNIRIGTKLAAISALGVLLVAGMLTGTLFSNAQIKAANASAILQQNIVREVDRLELMFISTRLSAQNIRLALTADELDAANNLLAQQKDIDEILQRMIPNLKTQAGRARAEEIQAGISQYISIVRTEIIPLKMETIGSADFPALAHESQRIQHEDLDPAANKVMELLKEISDSAADLAAQQSNAAEATMTSAEYLGVGIAVAVIVILIASAVFGAVGIARPLARIAAVLDDLTNDRIVNVPYADRGDEVGKIAKATEVFKESIAEKVINLRVRSALDVVRSSVMVTDDQFSIMYMNTSVKDMMRELKPELRKVLPSFDDGKLMGANMDVFYEDPARQRKLLENLTGSYETHFALGAVKFHLVATPVIDKHGRRAGTVLEWRNETAEKAIESEIDTVVTAAVAGDFSQRLPLEGKHGFMLNLATAVNGLCQNVADALDDLMRMFGALAGGDLTQRITADYQGAFATLKDDANVMADRLGGTIGEIKAAAREVSSAMKEISTSTTDLSQRTEEQAASLEETSASMEEMSATVKKNADNAQRANQSARATRDVADHGGRVVAKAVDAMADIEESSRKISDIIGVIDEIARQTNLLALNAAVEAARAGEAGRGFAVVASEVRSLAQRSSQAAKDIKDLITNSNGQVKNGVDLVNKAGTALNEIVESIKSVADIVADIAAASAEQAAGIEQVNKALTQMDEVTQQNAALVEENAATAKTLEQQASVMDERIGFFRIGEVEAVVGQMGRGAEAREAVELKEFRNKAAAGRVSGEPHSARNGTGNALAAANRRHGGAGRMQAALATAINDPDWKEF